MPYATDMVASISVLYVGALRGFSQQYHCHRLVWHETFDDVRVAASLG